MICVGAILFNLTTAALMVLMFKGGVLLIGEGTLRERPVPWAAVALTAVAVGAVLLQLSWSGAMDALDSDPRKSGWWRVVTSVFMQNGGVFGAVWNIATLAAIAALTQWFWGGPLMLALFAGGILNLCSLLVEHLPTGGTSLENASTQRACRSPRDSEPSRPNGCIPLIHVAHPAARKAWEGGALNLSTAVKTSSQHPRPSEPLGPPPDRGIAGTPSPPVSGGSLLEIACPGSAPGSTRATNGDCPDARQHCMGVNRVRSLRGGPRHFLCNKLAGVPQ